MFNPPWMTAKGFNKGLDSGVFDHEEKFLINGLKIAKENLNKSGILLLFYSDIG